MTIPSYTSTTASSALPVGTRLGEFEITGVIGEGGFGIVYSAHDSSLDRIVAIKEYLPSAFSNRTDAGIVQVKSEEHQKTFKAGLSSFINEAKMLARFSHPGLVEVFRFWEANGTAYMAMRYYRGVTMREMLRTAPDVVTEQWLCETLDPILLALKELHSEKCYHRDIAPDNIMVLPNGRSVLMDFGAARRIIGGMTHALTTVLKPGFAPIEQYSDDGSLPQGAWTDVYAVGGLLYHAMTGRVPVQSISRMMSDPLKPVQELARHSYSPQLCSAVMKSMAVLPANRPQSVDELRAALGWVTTLGSTIIRPARATPPAVDDYPPTMILQSSSAKEGRFPDIFPPARNEARGATASLPEAKFDPLATVTMMNPADGGSVKESPSEPAASFDPEATMTFRKPDVKGIDALAASTTEAELDPLAALTSPSKPVPLASAAPIDSDSREKPVSPQVGIEPGKTVFSGGSSRKPKVLPIVGGVVAAILVVGVAVFVYSSSHDGNTVNAPLPAAPVVAATTPPVAETLPKLPETPPAASENSSVNTAAEVAPVGGGGSAAAPIQSGAVAPVSVPPAPVTSKSDAVEVEKTGLVRFELKDGWGTVFVDGQQKGVVPPVMVLKLSPGTHEIELRNPALATVRRKVEVVAGKTLVVRHSFAK